MTAPKKIVVLLDGEEPTAAQLYKTIARSDLVIATDGAASYAKKHGISLNAIIGDMDSIDFDTREYFLSDNTLIIKNPDQATNDFEKALLYLKDEYAGSSLTVLGIHGKRTDHLLVNFSVMLRYANVFFRIEALDSYHTHLFLTDKQKELTIERPKGTLVTLLAFLTTVGITTTGLLYALKDAEMEFGKQEGLSNIISSDMGATVSIRSGSLLVSVAHEQ